MKLDLVRIACVAVLVSTTPCVQAGQHLPGSSMPPSPVFGEPIDFAAVCVAEDEPRVGEADHGTRSVTQRFRLLGLVVGRTGGRSVGEMRYRMSADGFERAVRKGERVIWVGLCEDKIWNGVYVLGDAPENRDAVYSRVAHRHKAQLHDALEVRVETAGEVFAPGLPIPIRVQIDNTSDSAIALWSNFSTLQFDVLAEDGEPVTCRRGRGLRFDRTEPLIVKQYRGPIETADLADRCDWLPSGEQRSYTLLWRGKVRVGDRKAEPFEMVSQPIRLTVRDPSTVAWGADGEGVTCGLAAERSNVSMGDRVMILDLDREPGEPHRPAGDQAPRVRLSRLGRHFGRGRRRRIPARVGGRLWRPRDSRQARELDVGWRNPAWPWARGRACSGQRRVREGARRRQDRGNR